MICAIVLNWNSYWNTVSCIFALLKSTTKPDRIIVIDNNSDVIDYNNLVKELSVFDCVNIVRQDINLGFAGGVNLGVKLALAYKPNPEYILIIDNDAFVETTCVSRLVSVIQSNNRIAAAVAMIYDYSKRTVQQSIVSRVNFWRGDVVGMDGFSRIFGMPRATIPDIPFTVEQYGFWCILFRASVLQKIGSLDESLFFTWETVDYCERLKRNGYIIACAPNAKVFHKWRTNNKTDGNTEYYNPRNRFIFMRRYATRFQYTLFLLFFFTVHFWLAIAYYLLWKRRIKILGRFFQGVKAGLLWRNA